MKIVLIGVGGVLTHVLSTVIAHYSQWLLAKVLRGEQGIPFVDDLCRFVRWLFEGLAEQLSDRRSAAAVRRYDDYEPEYYGR